MGYKKIITYILESENGASLKASGYKCIGKCGGLRWTGRSKPEVDLYPAQMKLRFEKEREDNGFYFIHSDILHERRPSRETDFDLLSGLLRWFSRR